MDLCGVGDDPNKRPDSAFEMMGNLISLALSCVMGYMVGRASYIFRKTGGLHGSVKDGATPLLIEDKVAGYVRDGAAIVDDIANKEMDKIDDEEGYKAAQ